MNQTISQYLSSDHERLDQLLQQSIRSDGGIDEKPYFQFRQGLLRHIGIEEKILIPALQAGLNDEMKKVLERIRMDHSVIVALLVPSPSKGIIDALTAILTKHNDLEELHGGFYEQADLLGAPKVEEILQSMQNAPEVKMLPNNPDPKVLEATRRAMERAGYNPDEYSL